MFSCNREGCNLNFVSKELLHDHQDYDEDHERCGYCNACFLLWDDLIDHKVAEAKKEIAEIRAWERQAKLRRHRDYYSQYDDEVEDEDNPKPEILHLCCKFCGIDFASITGRDLHIRNQHPVVQHINCPGCDAEFPHAAGMIRHLEEDKCEKIPRNVFLACVANKGLINGLMSDPEMFIEMQFDSWHKAAEDDNRSGGVTLLDERNAGASLVTPIEPDLSTEAKGKTKENNQADLLAALNRFHLSDSQKPKLEVRPLTEPTEPEQQQQSTPTWVTGGKASEKLFPNAKPTPPPAGIIPEDRKEVGGFDLHAFNPLHKRFNPERFYHPIKDAYVCPFPKCGRELNSPVKLKDHLLYGHQPEEYKCPTCEKRFKNFAALVSHSETSKTSRCFLSATEGFSKKMDDLTGGFLQAKVVARKDMKADEDGSEMSYVKFEASRPEGLPGREDPMKGKVRVGRRYNMRH